MKSKRLIGYILALAVCISAFCGAAYATAVDAAPYPDVDFFYSASVTAGTVRYVCQNPDSGYFYKNYWGSWAEDARHECLTASISMALSYVGVNITPQNILDKGNGTTMQAYAWGGASYLKPAFDIGFSNYLNGGGKYSPPIIHLDNYSTGGHYVLVIAKQSDGVYTVADPFQTTLWTIKISGSTATYDYYGVTKTDTVSDAMQYYNANASVPVTPSGSGKTLVFYIGSSAYTVNGASKSMDVSPYLKSGRTYLPARFVGEELGGQVSWDSATQTVTIAKDATTVKLTVGSTLAYLNGTPVTLDTAPEIVGGRTCLPIRFVAQSFGADVSWTQAASAVTITLK